MPNKIELTRRFDAWSIVHLLGCYFLMTLGLSWAQTLILGICWECFDFIYSYVRYELSKTARRIIDMILDQRGADVMDIAFDIAGIMLYLILNYYKIVG